MAKDKFKQMQEKGGGGSTFQRLAEQAATVAAIENQAAVTNDGLVQTQVQNPVQNRTNPSEVSTTPAAGNATGAKLTVTSVAVNGHKIVEVEEWQEDAVRYMRLPNPQIPVNEYNLVSAYCNSLTNMTRQDWVELAIIEKLHRDNQITDDEFEARRFEIRNRPRRGQRKGFRVIRDSASN